VVTELDARGHDVRVFESTDAWSVKNLEAEPAGAAVVRRVRALYPTLDIVRYRPGELDLESALDGAALAIVHQWNEPELVRAVGEQRARDARLRILFHDTHHRAVTAPDELARLELSRYDAVLAFGSVLRDLYLANGWCERAFVWHEAADVRVFRPQPDRRPKKDVVFIGNWVDDERTASLREFLFAPARRLGFSSRVHGVRYPETERAELAKLGVEYGGFLPNFLVPSVFANFRATVHVPRAPYAKSLHGIPTICPFEALACGIPLVSAPWDDIEGLFRPGRDYLLARTGGEAERYLRDVCNDETLAAEIARAGLETIRARHTCAHRVDELLGIAREIGVRGAWPAGQGLPSRFGGAYDSMLELHS
jgi:spore maturation protein CgeB